MARLKRQDRKAYGEIQKLFKEQLETSDNSSAVAGYVCPVALRLWPGVDGALWLGVERGLKHVECRLIESDQSHLPDRRGS